VGATTLGIIVDRIFDTEEIVVKPVAPVLRGISMFSGNTILGDGSVIMILDTNGIARATGTAGGEMRATAKTEAERLALAAGSSARTAMLLFRAGSTEPKAVPLGLIEFSAGSPVIQYRGHLMPLVPMTGALDMERAHQAVLVFADVDKKLGRDRSMGLVVDEIVDVVEDQLRIELSGDRPGMLGTAVIAGHATDVVDIGYWLNHAFGDWFGGGREGKRSSARVLVVEDSDFFRQLVVPILSAAGNEVMAANDGAQALRMRDAGLMFDIIVSDIGMPEVDGLEFVRRVRAEGPWADLPVIALTANGSAAAVEAGRAAGFTDYVHKFDRDTLLASLRTCLAARGETQLAA
jgi:two-component system chemotaxis sensor kinase CheA